MRQRLSKDNDLGLLEGQRELADMTALQELSVRLSLVTRSLLLSILRESASRLDQRHRRLHVRAFPSSGASPGVVVSYCLVPLFSRAPYRHGLKLFAVERRGRGSSTMDELSFTGLKISGDDIDCPTGYLPSDAPEEIENKKIPDANAQYGASEYVAYVHKDVHTKELQPPNYLAMSDKQLFSKCRMDTYRASGPGGQHRNKTDSAVRLTHIPTGLVSQAADDRSQHMNRSLALTRLRQTIALEVRNPVDLDGYEPPLELVRILPGGTGGKRGNSQRIGPNHPDFILGMKALMDLLHATGGSVSDSGKLLGLTTGALSKLITSNNLLWQGVNKLRSLQKQDAIGVLGFSPIRKVTAAVMMLAYGIAVDATDEYCRLGESMTMEALKQFTRAFREVFKSVYLRQPTKEDLQK